jgi:hypothetical protein
MSLLTLSRQPFADPHFALHDHLRSSLAHEANAMLLSVLIGNLLHDRKTFRVRKQYSRMGSSSNSVWSGLWRINSLVPGIALEATDQ